MKNILLIRHGQSEWNLQKKFTGWVDVGLSENGVKEASNAGDLLINEKFIPDICFTSFLKRSIDTADILLNKYEDKKYFIYNGRSIEMGLPFMLWAPTFTNKKY